MLMVKFQATIICFAVGLLTLSVENFLIVSIFSSRENFDKRLALRRTWLRSVSEDPLIKYHFVLGNTMCPVPPETRKDPFGCETIHKMAGVKGNATFSTAFKNERKPSYATGFGFRADRTIVVTHLGLPACLASKLSAPARIKLLDAHDRREILSVSFDSLQEKTEYLTKAIRPVTFPAMSEGILLVSFMSDSDAELCKFSDLSWNEEKFVTFTSIFLSNRNVVFKSSSSVCAFMYYTSSGGIDDGDKGRDISMWNKEMNFISQEVEKEIHKFNDILVVNATDYYYNLPVKLLSLIRHISGEDYEFLLKTDDDTLIDIAKVVAELKSVKMRKLWWWSTFKEYNFVPLAGKWQERKYSSATYPPYPCGGGYVINRYVVDYLASVSDYLVTFQGEDVSIGVWLAGVDVVRHEASAGNMPTYKDIMLSQSKATCQWVCENSTTKGSCNLVQLSITELYSIWDKYQKHGYLKA